MCYRFRQILQRNEKMYFCLQIYLGGPMDPIHPVWAHVLVSFSPCLVGARMPSAESLPYIATLSLHTFNVPCTLNVRSLNDTVALSARASLCRGSPLTGRPDAARNIASIDVAYCLPGMDSCKGCLLDFLYKGQRGRILFLKNENCQNRNRCRPKCRRGLG